MTTANDTLMDLERRFWRAIRDNDVDTASGMTNDPCIVTGASGVASIDSKMFASMMANDSWELHDFSFSDVQVQELSDDVAVVAYKVREDLTVDGSPLTLEAADSSTWMRSKGEWRCVLHTEALLGDPFGRDRSTPLES